MIGFRVCCLVSSSISFHLLSLADGFESNWKQEHRCDIERFGSFWSHDEIFTSLFDLKRSQIRRVGMPLLGLVGMLVVARQACLSTRQVLLCFIHYLTFIIQHSFCLLLVTLVNSVHWWLPRSWRSYGTVNTQPYYDTFRTEQHKHCLTM